MAFEAQNQSVRAEKKFNEIEPLPPPAGSSCQQHCDVAVPAPAIAGELAGTRGEPAARMRLRVPLLPLGLTWSGKA